MTSQGSDTVTSIFKCNSSNTIKCLRLVFVGTLNIRLNSKPSEFFGRQRECRSYTAGCGNKMAVSVTGPRAVNKLGGPVIPGRRTVVLSLNCIMASSPYRAIIALSSQRVTTPSIYRLTRTEHVCMTCHKHHLALMNYRISHNDGPVGFLINPIDFPL